MGAAPFTTALFREALWWGMGITAALLQKEGNPGLLPGGVEERNLTGG